MQTLVLSAISGPITAQVGQVKTVQSVAKMEQSNVERVGRRFLNKRSVCSRGVKMKSRVTVKLLFAAELVLSICFGFS